MTGTIVVAIPNKCYISPDPKREFPFEFYFHVTYGGVPKESRILSNPSCDKTVETVTYPQITVGGFEKLLSEDKITPFLNDLKRTGDDDWLIKKHAANSNILFQYIGTELAPEFFSGQRPRNLYQPQKTTNWLHSPSVSGIFKTLIIQIILSARRLITPRGQNP